MKYHVTETLATAAHVPRGLASTCGSMWAPNVKQQEIFIAMSILHGKLQKDVDNLENN